MSPGKKIRAGPPRGKSARQVTRLARLNAGPSRKTGVVVRLITMCLRTRRARSQYSWKSGRPFRPAKNALTRLMTPASKGANKSPRSIEITGPPR